VNTATLKFFILYTKGSLFLMRPGLVHYVADREELLRRASDLFKWMTAGELQVRIDQTYPLAEAGEAHRYLQARKTMGKVLLIP
jgi:NADPH2:quinone reductase